MRVDFVSATYQPEKSNLRISYGAIEEKGKPKQTLALRWENTLTVETPDKVADSIEQVYNELEKLDENTLREEAELNIRTDLTDIEQVLGK